MTKEENPERWGVLAGQKHLYTADFKALELSGTFKDSEKIDFSVKFMQCVPENGLICAEQEDLNEWMSQHIFTFDTLDNFVDLNGPSQEVQQLVNNRLYNTVSDIQDTLQYFKVKETRVSFSDSRINFMGLSEPVEKRFLNFEDQLTEKYNFSNASHFGVKVSLSNRVQIQNRLVYDMFAMLGDVGGLYDFFCVTLAFFFGIFSERLFVVSLVKKLFKVSQAPPNDPEATPQSKFDSIAAFKMHICEQLLYALSCGSLPRGGKKRVLSKVQRKIEKQLDLVTMIKKMRAFNALLRLLLTYKERRLIHL